LWRLNIIPLLEILVYFLVIGWLFSKNTTCKERKKSKLFPHLPETKKILDLQKYKLPFWLLVSKPWKNIFWFIKKITILAVESCLWLPKEEKCLIIWKKLTQKNTKKYSQNWNSENKNLPFGGFFWTNETEKLFIFLSIWKKISAMTDRIEKSRTFLEI